VKDWAKVIGRGWVLNCMGEGGRRGGN